MPQCFEDCCFSLRFDPCCLHLFCLVGSYRHGWSILCDTFVVQLRVLGLAIPKHRFLFTFDKRSFGVITAVCLRGVLFVQTYMS